MSKIVQAVNAMIANPKLITKVIKGENELFFLYKDKYKWSMDKREQAYFLWFYPGDQTLESLASFEAWDWSDGFPMVMYQDVEIGTKEAKASFSELYRLLKERVYGVNEVLDDIISDGDIVF
jgi:hypothetical protein